MAADLFDAEDEALTDESAPESPDEGVTEDQPYDPDQDTDEGVTEEDAAAVAAEQAQEARIRAAIERDRERTLRKVAQALEGNAQARAELEATRGGKRALERAEQARHADLAQASSQLIAAQRWVQETDALADPSSQTYDLDEYRTRMRQFGREYAYWSAQVGSSPTLQPQMQAQARPQAVRPAGGDVAERYFDRLQGKPENADLTPEDWDELDPDNEQFAGMDPEERRDAISDAYLLVRAKADARKRARPATERGDRIAAAGAGVQRAVAGAPPVVGGGRPAREMTEQQAIAAYIDNPTPKTRADYERIVRKANGWA